MWMLYMLGWYLIDGRRGKAPAAINHTATVRVCAADQDRLILHRCGGNMSHLRRMVAAHAIRLIILEFSPFDRIPHLRNPGGKLPAMDPYTCVLLAIMRSSGFKPVS